MGWQSGARLGLDETNIGTVDGAVDRHVFAEVTGGDGVPGFGLGLRNVARIDRSVGIGISEQEAGVDGDVPVIAGRIDHAVEDDSDAGRFGHSAQVGEVLVGVGSDPAGIENGNHLRTGAGGGGGGDAVHAGKGILEYNHERLVALGSATAAFHSGHYDVEIADTGVRFARDHARHRGRATGHADDLLRDICTRLAP